MTKTNFTLSLSAAPETARKSPPWTRRLLAASAMTIGLGAGLFVAAHEVPGFGPWAADTLRSAIGVEGVARLEDAAYAMKDAVHQVTRHDEAPKSYWEVPAAAAPFPLTQVHPLAPEEEPWTPKLAEVPFPAVAAEGDGVWVEMSDVGKGSEMKKTLLHPDPGRTWAELFVVAIDLQHAELNWVPGTIEPLNVAPGSEKLARAGRIPRDAEGALLAAFNGGFKTQHGKFGARSEGVTLVSPRPHQCTLGQTRDGELVLGTYKDLENADELSWLRQTPGCMVEDGKIHPQLVSDTNTNWGATLDGGTVIRRSALGLSEDGATLYIGISNDTTARALALGMQAAGAHTVAQLDVNYAYPKFVLYDESQAGLTPRSLAEGFVMHDSQYLRPEARDFFYLTGK